MSKDPAERFLETKEGMSFPDCMDCMHYVRPGRTCPAFPNGIPTDIHRARIRHREVRPDQVGAYVFTPDGE